MCVAQEDGVFGGANPAAEPVHGARATRNQEHDWDGENGKRGGRRIEQEHYVAEESWGHASSNIGDPPCTPAKPRAQSCLGRRSSPKKILQMMNKRRRIVAEEERGSKAGRALSLMLSDKWSPSTTTTLPGPARSRAALDAMAGVPLRGWLEEARDASTDRILNLCRSYDVSSNTLTLAVGILDKFLEGRLSAIDSAVAHGKAGEEIALEVEDTCRVEIPVAVFLIACKFREWSSPRLLDLAELNPQPCTTAHLREAENFILQQLKWDVDVLTATDVLALLLSFAPKEVATVLRGATDKYIEVGYCSRKVSAFGAGVLAITALRMACDELGLDAAVLDFVPDTRAISPAHVQECLVLLGSYVALHAMAAQNMAAREDVSEQVLSGAMLAT
ncbi:hypothetical protein T484DRAFT_2085002 [Baffinella frigidus]|nr:hypothetical protein T484DRAFT_2085002 [Cryptophyta sp. CCMP2293]